MADNVTLPGTGLDVATDDIASKHYQRIKLIHGADGVNDGDVSSTNPLPASGPDCITLLSTTISATGVSSSIDTDNYKSIVFQFSGLWTGNLRIDTSNDNSNWDTTQSLAQNDPRLVDSITQSGVYVVIPSGRYLRIYTTNITGTITVLVLGRAVDAMSAAGWLSLAMDRATTTPLQVQLNGIKADAEGALILADGDGPYRMTASGQTLVIDTLGYTRVDCVAANLLGGTVTASCSNEIGGSWSALYGVTIHNANANAPYAPSTSLIWTTAGGAIQFPAAARYIRLVSSGFTAGAVLTVYKRTGPLSPANAQQTNLALVGGSTLVAENSSIAQNVFAVGGTIRTALRTAGTSGAASFFTMSSDGVLIVEKHAIPALTWNYAAAASGIVSSTTAVTIKAAVASQRGNVSSLQLYADSGGTATEFALRDGAAGTVMWRAKIPATGMALVNVVFDPPLRQAAVNTLLEIVTLTSSAGATYCNVQGFMSN